MHELSLALKRFEWIHTTLGIFGNTLFVIGSVFFLYQSLQTEGTWLFIVGSSFMLIGALGSGILKIWQVEDHRREQRRSHATAA